MVRLAGLGKESLCVSDFGDPPPPHVRAVDLSFNSLRDLPDDVGRFLRGTLEAANLSKNRLARVPHALLRCGKLRDLDVDSNPIRAFSGIRALSGSLESLSAANCESVRCLDPDEWGGMGSLSLLHVPRCSISGLDEALFERSLRPANLCVSRNAIPRLPRSFANLSGCLRVLRVAGNPLGDAAPRPPLAHRITKNARQNNGGGSTSAAANTAFLEAREAAGAAAEQITRTEQFWRVVAVLASLEELDASRCGLGGALRLGRLLSALPRLRTLRAAHNCVSSIEWDASEALADVAIADIDLHDNEIAGAVDGRLWCLPHIASVNLARNAIAGLDEPPRGSVIGPCLDDVCLIRNPALRRSPAPPWVRDSLRESVSFFSADFEDLDFKADGF